MHRFYDDLAPWWPLISPVEDYAEEGAFSASVLAGATDPPPRRVLELGSGGGHMAYHLKAHVELVLVDLSPSMLEQSRRLNPECRHVVGDMRDVRLDETFDAVFVHDAIDYMTTEDDLRRALATAHAHCRAGGAAVVVPDHLAETYADGTDDADHGGSDGPDGRGVRFLDWSRRDGDGNVVTEYAFLLRDADGRVEAVHETHRTGLFALDTWLRLLEDAGFDASTVEEVTTEDRTPRTFFVGRRPR